MNIDVLSLGEILIDFATESVDETGYPTMSAHPGGAPANFLAVNQKYGLNTGMIGKVGTDAFGKMPLMRTPTGAFHLRESQVLIHASLRTR